MIVCTSVNHSPEQVLTLLGNPSYAISDVSTDSDVVILKTYQDFLRVFPLVNKKRYREKIAIVFCSPLDEYNISGHFSLDSDGPEATTSDSGFKDIDIFPRRVKIEKNNLLEDKIIQIKKGSLLNPLMSYIYTLSSLFQKPVKFMACAYIYYSSTEEKMKRALNDMEKKHDASISLKSKERLFSILRSKPCKVYRKAFSRVRKGKPIDDLSVNNYEMSYILASIKIGDEYVEFFANPD